MTTRGGRSSTDGGIALILFAIFVLDHPFGGDLRMGPEKFEFVAGKIEGNGTR